MTEYLNCIISIRDKETNITHAGTIDVQQIAAKYSNTKKPIYKIFMDNKPISRNNSYVVKYECLVCETHQEITLNLFVRKISNSIRCCNICKNRDEEKKTAQSEFMKSNAKLLLDGSYVKPDKSLRKDMSLSEHITHSNDEWHKEDAKFQSQYILQHLTVEEFERIKHAIKGVNNYKLTDLSGWEYVPNYRVWNQTRYTPMLINKSLNIVDKPQYISFDCENCECRFTHRDLEIVKNKIKIYCKDCSFSNKTFKIRHMTLKSGEKIKWQSVPERRFIEWCEDNNIAIKNGPNIEYDFNSTRKTYRVDFELPEYRFAVEIKDNHCWYKEQVLSGKQPAKEKAANEWCKEFGYNYQVVFPKTIQEFKNKILSCKI